VPSLMNYKKVFFANRMLSLSRDKFISGSIAGGRKAYWQALRLHPLVLFRWSYLRKYIKSFFDKETLI